jgi:signal transduction histidine kinase
MNDRGGPDTIRVLLIDDDEDDFVLTRDLLAEIPGTPFHLDWVSDESEALPTIQGCDHDLYLVDFRLGQLTGVDLIRAARAEGCEGPFILLTGLDERSVDFEAMRAGAADYLVKADLNAAVLERAIRYTLQQKRHADELERKVRERTAELDLANQALRDADRRKDSFLATLAHELRNPLVPIRNALEIMRLASGKPEVVEKSRALIERQMRHLVRLIDDLLDIARISRGQIHLRREPIGLAEIVEDASESCRPLLEQFRHTLSITLPDRPIVLTADRMRLAQVLLNLLNNAARYSPPESRIDLTGSVEGRDAVISIRDPGAGIHPDDLPRLFEMFATIRRQPGQNPGGLGIGLSLVKSLVELHGGQVSAHSEGPGLGTEFTIRLPLEGPDS